MYDHCNNFNAGDQYRSGSATGMYRPVEQLKPAMRPPQPQYNMQHHSEVDYHRSGLPLQPATPSTIFPRSASEALFDTTSKFRQLPCRTFISVGTCPYRERCVYLHDPRCICKEAKTKTRRKNKEDVVLDALFWPVMPFPMVSAKLDMNRQPHVIQSYSVPLPMPDQYHRHDAAVYSLWMHFVDFCMANADASAAARGNADQATCFCAPDVPINGYTEEPRLHLFRFLSSCHGRALTRDELVRATAPGVPAFAKGVNIPVAPVPRRPPVQQQGQQYPEDGSNSTAYYGAGPDSALSALYNPTSHGAYVAERPGTLPLQQQQQQQQALSHSAALLHPQYPPPQQQADRGLYAQSAPVTAFNLQQQVRDSTLSNSPITVASTRSPQRFLPGQGPTGPMEGHIPKTRDQFLESTTVAAAPTTLSVLMTAPARLPQHQSSSDLQLQHWQSLRSDSWHSDSFGADTDNERDSGGSFFSVVAQDTPQSAWRNDYSSIGGITSCGAMPITTSRTREGYEERYY